MFKVGKCEDGHNPTCILDNETNPLSYMEVLAQEDASRNYIKYCIKCHQFYLSCSILIVNPPCSVTNTKCKPDIYLCHFLCKEH